MEAPYAITCACKVKFEGPNLDVVARWFFEIHQRECRTNMEARRYRNLARQPTVIEVPS